MGGPSARPERTCVGCRRAAPKDELVRIVRTAEGSLALDRYGRAPGRGAYLHRDRECADLAARRGSVARALRTSIPPDEVSNLLREITGSTG